MKRNEAIICLKEILQIDNGLSPDAVTFRQSHDSSDYTLHIKGVTQ